MCDCYAHKCEECDAIVPMHIGDFKFPREAFKAWCDLHVDLAPAGAVVFTLAEAETDDGPGWPGLPKGWRCAILGPEVGDEGGNYPNIAANYKEEQR